MTANAQSKSLNTLSTNNIHSCIRRMYVVYESSGFFSTDKDNLDYISELLKLQTFSTIVYTPHSICDGVYEWYVPCDEIPNDICNFRCQNMNLDADSAIHTRGAPVHERDRSSLAPDEEDDDPFCSRCPKDYSWVYSETPSCDEIKGSIRR